MTRNQALFTFTLLASGALGFHMPREQSVNFFLTAMVCAITIVSLLLIIVQHSRTLDDNALERTITLATLFVGTSLGAATTLAKLMLFDAEGKMSFKWTNRGLAILYLCLMVFIAIKFYRSVGKIDREPQRPS